LIITPIEFRVSTAAGAVASSLGGGRVSVPPGPELLTPHNERDRWALAALGTDCRTIGAD